MGSVNGANLRIRYGVSAAVTLVETVASSHPGEANHNDELWAHELRHIRKIRGWGTRDCPLRYLRSWNDVA